MSGLPIPLQRGLTLGQTLMILKSVVMNCLTAYGHDRNKQPACNSTASSVLFCVRSPNWLYTFAKISACSLPTFWIMFSAWSSVEHWKLKMREYPKWKLNIEPHIKMNIVRRNTVFHIWFSRNLGGLCNNSPEFCEFVPGPIFECTMIL